MHCQPTYLTNLKKQKKQKQKPKKAHCTVQTEILHVKGVRRTLPASDNWKN
jgi:hypothetical protein